MKVGSSGGVSGAGGSYAPARAAAGGFAVSNTGGASDAAPMARAAGPTGVGSLDALLALQEVGGPLERRRRAVRRAGRILDVLDEVKMALLDGGLPPAALERLMAAICEERGGTEDARLEGLLDEIETRAAVELAKLEMARAAA